jgi:hypothetical protein
LCPFYTSFHFRLFSFNFPLFAFPFFHILPPMMSANITSYTLAGGVSSEISVYTSMDSKILIISYTGLCTEVKMCAEVGIDTFKSNGALLSSVSHLINSSFRYF